MRRAAVPVMIVFAMACVGCPKGSNPFGGNAAPPPTTPDGVAGASRDVKVGMTYADVLSILGKPQRIYGAGTPVMVYPLPKDTQLKIGIAGLDNQSKVLWIKKFDSVGHELK